MSNQEQLQHSTGEIGPEVCPECEHPLHEGECEYEDGDRWVEGENCGGLVAQGPCGCRFGIKKGVS